MRAFDSLEQFLALKHNHLALANVHVVKGVEVILREVSVGLGAALEAEKVQGALAMDVGQLSNLKLVWNLVDCFCSSIATFQR